MKDLTLYQDILKVIGEHDMSCTCCGPTDKEEMAQALAKVILNHIYDAVENKEEPDEKA